MTALGRKRKPRKITLAICGAIGHDWYNLTYPPTLQRKQCGRCGVIVEDEG